MNAWLPQASYPCGNFSDTSSLKLLKTKGSIGHAFTVCIHTENQNQMSFFPFDQHEISVLIELILGHLRYLLTDVPPQPNSPPDNVFDLDSRCRGQEATMRVRGQATAGRGNAPLRAHCSPKQRLLPCALSHCALIPTCVTDVIQETLHCCKTPLNRISKITFRVVVFQDWLPSHLCYTSKVISQCRTRVKLNRVFFPR